MAEISPFLRTDFKAVDKREALHSVKGWLTGDTTKLPIVTDDGRPFGIVNQRALMGRHLDLNAHVHQFTLATRALPEAGTLEQARGRMAEFRAAYLPVEDERSKPLGYLRAIDIARANGGSPRAVDLAVPVTTLREDNTMGDALHAFTKEYVEFLPVLRSDGRVTGVLGRSEILKMEFNNGDKGRRDAGGEKFTILNDPVAGFMDEAPAIVPPTLDFPSLARTLEETGYAIVGAADRVVGVVTEETLFRAGGR